MNGKFGFTTKFCGCFVLLLCAALSGRAYGQALEQAKRYALQPGDEVAVQYRYTPEFNQTVKVQPDGFVTLEIIGEIKLGGLNLREAQALVADRAKTRLKDPVVTLTLKEFERPYFVVAGEVPKPGKFEFREHITALQAVMLAGGFNEQAQSSQIVLIRKTGADRSEVKLLNLKRAAKQGGEVADLPLQPGDMLMIPQNTITRVERYLKAANIGMFINPLQWVY